MEGLGYKGKLPSLPPPPTVITIMQYYLLLVALLVDVVAIEVTPEGSDFEAFSLGPKDHSNGGEGTLEGREIGSKRVTEHINV